MNLKNQKLIIAKTFEWKAKPFSNVLLSFFFLFIGANPIFSQVQVEIQEQNLVEDGYALNSGDDSVLPLPYGVYPSWRGFHSKLTFDNDPNINIPVGEWQESKPDKVHFQYGIEGMQEVTTEQQQNANVAFSKRYSVRYYFDKRNTNGTIQYKYHRKFYYNKGHVNLQMGDEMHVLYHEISQKYMLYHVSGEDKVLLECEKFKIVENTNSYISQYGRPTDAPSLGSPAAVTHHTEDLLSHALYAWSNQDVSWQTILRNLINTKTDCATSPCASYYETLPAPRGCDIQSQYCTTPEGRKFIVPETGEVSVYPNPTSGMTTIEVNSLADEIIEIKIIDLTGKLVKQQKWNVTTGSNLTQVDMTSAPAGVYHVEFDSKYKFESQKIIIIK